MAMRRSTQAIKAQLDRIAHGYRYNFTSDPAGGADRDRAPGLRAGSGLPAWSSSPAARRRWNPALKLALQYHGARGEPSRCRFIARERSWHGNTLGALAVSGFRERRAALRGRARRGAPLSPVNAYRPPAGVKPDDAWPSIAPTSWSRRSRGWAPHVAAFIFEPVVGAAGGAVPAPPGYAKRVREICDRHGVLMIADEVMCGAGRCGTWRALEHDGVAPDIMAVAKGLAGGYLPLGAAIYSQERRGSRMAAAPWRADDRPYLHRPHRRLRRRRRGADASSRATGCVERGARRTGPT